MAPSHDDPEDLRRRQYRDSRHLNSRIELHRRFSTNPVGWMHWLFGHLALTPGAAVLEIGCGPGTLWRERVGSLPAGLRLTLSDLSRGMVAEARAALPWCHAVVADAQALPLPDGRFDLVLASFVLHHVPDVPRALAEFRRVLRPDGRLVVATFGGDHLGGLRALARRLDDSLPLGSYEPPPNFRLEWGGPVLERVFATVERHDYPDALRIDDPALTAAYLLSSDSAADDDPRYPRLVELIAAELAAGPLHVAKVSGLFIARS